MSSTSSLLRLEVPREYAALMELEHALPPLLQAFDWSLKYRLSRDGASLGTLMRQAHLSTPLLLMVRVDVEGGGSYLVGGLASRALGDKVQGTANEIVGTGKWKGTGQSFLFNMVLEAPPGDQGMDLDAGGGALQTFGWSRRSSCFQLVGNREGLAFGGGGDFGYGLWCDPQLQVCTSSSCLTYGNTSSLLHPASFASRDDDDPQMIQTAPDEGAPPPHPGAVTGSVVEMECWAFV